MLENIGIDVYCDISSLVHMYMYVIIVQVYGVMSRDDVILRWQCGEILFCGAESS